MAAKRHKIKIENRRKEEKKKRKKKLKTKANWQEIGQEIKPLEWTKKVGFQMLMEISVPGTEFYMELEILEIYM